MSLDVQGLIDAVVAIVNSDATLRTLFGRTSDLLTHAEDLAVDPVTPLLVFKPQRVRRAESGFAEVPIEFTAFAATPTVANRACARLAELFFTPGVTWALFNANGAPGVVQSPTAEPVLDWPDVAPTPDDAAPCCASITLAFLPN